MALREIQDIQNTNQLSYVGYFYSVAVRFNVILLHFNLVLYPVYQVVRKTTLFKMYNVEKFEIMFN